MLCLDISYFYIIVFKLYDQTFCMSDYNHSVYYNITAVPLVRITINLTYYYYL